MRSGLRSSPAGGHDNPLLDSCLENPTDRGTWWATVHEVTKAGHEWATKHSMQSDKCRLDSASLNFFSNKNFFKYKIKKKWKYFSKATWRKFCLLMPPAAWRTVNELSVTGHYLCSTVESTDAVQSHLLYEPWAKSKCFSHEWVILPGQICFHGKEVWRSTYLAFYIASGLWKNKGPSSSLQNCLTSVGKFFFFVCLFFTVTPLHFNNLTFYYSIQV